MNLGITRNLTETGHSGIRIRKKESQKKCQKKKKEKTKRKSKRDWTGGFVGAVFGKPDGYAFACLVLPAVRR